MDGTAGERLAELAYRLRYDCMRHGADGAVRQASASWRAHTSIKVQRDLGFYAHPSYVVSAEWPLIHSALMNRPGVHLCDLSSGTIAVDLKAALEWDETTPGTPTEDPTYSSALGVLLRSALCAEAPQVVDLVPSQQVAWAQEITQIESFRVGGPLSLVAPVMLPYAARVSLYLFGSRAAMSCIPKLGKVCAYTERSPYDCEDADAPSVDPPLLVEFLLDARVPKSARTDVREDIAGKIHATRSCYVSVLESLTIAQLPDGADDIEAANARRQARAVASAILPGQVATEAIVTATVRQWVYMMLRFRRSPDTELRHLFTSAVPAALLASRYGRLVKEMLPPS